jgi:murein DD-endopeptidase MepM/ murein hydrolase activator NlpD
MVEYGCSPAPYYDPDPRCPGHQGFHHGVDIAVPCGTPITAGVAGRVIPPDSPGTPGPAYGSTAFRIRTAAGQDVLIGHARRVFVRPGDAVRRGELIALAGSRGAPDGCHLHLEVRRHGGGYADAVSPMPIADLRR